MEDGRRSKTVPKTEEWARVSGEVVVPTPVSLFLTPAD